MLALTVWSSSAWVTPLALAAVRRAMSTVRMTSAGRVETFREDAVFQALVEEQHLRLDSGLGGEGVEHRLDQVGLAVGVDVHHAIGGGGAGKRGHRERRAQGEACLEKMEAHWALLVIVPRSPRVCPFLRHDAARVKGKHKEYNSLEEF
jgi:hypothetical protein